MSADQGANVSGAFWSLSPVVAITSFKGEEVNGQIGVTIVNASILHSHPRLLVGIWKTNYTHDFIMESGRMCVHLLRTDQIATVRNFGMFTGRERDKFAEFAYAPGVTGCPVLKDAHSYAECEVVNAMDGGDMTSFLVKVVRGGILSGGEWMTLSHFYTLAPPEWIAQYETRLAQSMEIALTRIGAIDYTPWKP